MFLLEGVDGVVNASGALQTGMTDNLGALQQNAIVALADACIRSDIRTFVQISAPGACPEAATEFLRTKGVADDHIRRSGLDWIILKPGLVISAEAYGGTALIRMLASLPYILPLVHADAVVGTVDVDDVVDCVIAGMDGRYAARTEAVLVEDRPGRLRDVVTGFREHLGYSPPFMFVELPEIVATATGRVADALGWLGWRSPLRSTSMDVIKGGVANQRSQFEHLMGRPARSFQETLRRLPSNVQERWFARLYLAMPIMIATLSLFWLASGVIGVVQIDEAADHLKTAGMDEAMARLVVAGGGFADILLGLAVLVRPLARCALFGMAAVTAGYLAAGTVISPELWLDPIGPYVKTIPAAVLALVAAALVRTR